MQYKNYLYSICTILGIISNLEMIYSIQEDMCRSYANTMPFYMGDLSICRFWYLQEGPGTNPLQILMNDYIHCFFLYIHTYDKV